MPANAVRSLIVGSTGQIGTAILNHLGAASAYGSSTKVGEAHAAIDLARVSARGNAAELDALEFDALYCVGGFTDVEGCEAERARAFATNAVGPSILARQAARRGVPFVYFSTDYVFDGSAGPYSEDDVPHPLSAYGESKLMGERLVAQECPAALILRTTVVYGPDPRGKNFVYSLARALREHRTFRVPYDQVGTPTYNCDIALLAVELVRKGASGIYNVSGPDLLSRYDFALEIAACLGQAQAAIDGVATADLAQLARRPLRGGLRIDKVRAAIPNIPTRDVRSAMHDWAALGGLP
jgi:dTDP-4-dehydrorhamnose reductase